MAKQQGASFLENRQLDYLSKMCVKFIVNVCWVKPSKSETNK